MTITESVIKRQHHAAYSTIKINVKNTDWKSVDQRKKIKKSSCAHIHTLDPYTHAYTCVG